MKQYVCSISRIPPLSVHLSTNYLYQVKVFLSMLTIYPTNIDHTTYLLKSGKFQSDHQFYKIGKYTGQSLFLWDRGKLSREEMTV